MDDAAPGNDTPSQFPDGEGFCAGHRIQPLIGGQQTFAAIEAAISQAQSTVHMAYWTFDPALRTSTDPDNATLRDLLRAVVCRGVALRIVLADFDPVIGGAFHYGVWEVYRELMAITDGLDADCASRMAVMCSRHDMHWGVLARTAAQPILRYKLAEKVAAINRRETTEQRAACLGNLPGLWPFLRFSDGRVSVKPMAYPGFYPAAHHEKLCVIDDRIVFLGGLDIDTKRQDNWSHDNAYPWHDVACQLEGPAARFFATHFRCRWNQERVDSLAFLKGARPPPGVRPLPGGHGIPELGAADATDDDLPGPTEARPLRTLSKQGRSGFSRSPTTQITEIRDAYLEVINQAEEFLYIETQYIRSAAIASALAERASAQPALELILVLPLVPEDAFVEGEPNIATRHGQYLRKTNTDRLFQAFGDRIGVFSMQMPRNDELPDAEDAAPEEIIRNTVYIHAKTMVCDDRTAIIGSANLNDRSLVTDTETAVLWRGVDSVRDYRITLWRHALNIDTSDWAAPHLARWQAIARANAEGPATGQYPFIVPIPRDDLDAYARRSWLVPNELV